jgi:septum formation protein
MCATRLILASASPRRKALLYASGLQCFDVIESGISEARRAGEGGHDYALRVACDKALTVSTKVPRALVLAADTIVICENEILLKPKSEDDACRMLMTLSGRTHSVVTAYALASGGAILEAQPIVSHVAFHCLSEQQVREYIASGEPMDKAGAYGIQGKGGAFIAQVVGSRENVMGLPVHEVMAALARFGFSPNS